MQGLDSAWNRAMPGKTGNFLAKFVFNGFDASNHATRRRFRDISYFKWARKQLTMDINGLESHLLIANWDLGVSFCVDAGRSRRCHLQRTFSCRLRLNHVEPKLTGLTNNLLLGMNWFAQFSPMYTTVRSFFSRVENNLAWAFGFWLKRLTNGSI